MVSLLETSSIEKNRNDDEHSAVVGCSPHSSHADQWNQFLCHYNSQREIQQDDSTTKNGSSLTIKERQQLVDRLDFQDPFSVQVEGEGSFAEDWYNPAYVNIEYHSDSGHIKSLDFYNCSFRTIPDSVWDLVHLERLEVHAMEELTSLAENNDALQRHSNLKELVIDECYSVAKLPSLPDSLTCVRIKACHRMTFLPKSIVEASNLKVLEISNMMLPMGPYLPSSLQELSINGSEVRIRKLKLYLSQVSSQLKSLRLSMCDLNDQQVGQLWHQVLPLCPGLQKLNLAGNNIQSLSSLTTSTASTTTTTRLRALHMEANPVINSENEAEHLLTLLEQNPELCSLGDAVNWNLPFYERHSISIQRTLEDNFAGILKQDDEVSSSSCPLGLWSHVLTSANKNDSIARCSKSSNDTGKASLIYNVLQGPAFVERLPHSYHCNNSTSLPL